MLHLFSSYFSRKFFMIFLMNLFFTSFNIFYEGNYYINPANLSGDNSIILFRQNISSKITPKAQESTF